MAKVKSGIGVVGVVVVALANVATTWAQSDDSPRRLRERIGRTLADEWHPSAASSFQKITASDGTDNDHFGHSVAISGDTAIVASVGGDSAYIYQLDEGGTDDWRQVTKITASDAAAMQYFGKTVAISGDTAIVGDPYDDDNGAWSGSVYVYQRNEGGADAWGEVTKIIASDGKHGAWFGWRVAISGDTVIVGAWKDSGRASLAGSAYLYRRDEGGANNWGEVTKITASDAVGEDAFGRSVAISGDTAIVGASQSSGDGMKSGSAYVYRRNEGGVDNWGEVTKITASDAAAIEYFGNSVAISGDTAIVGTVGGHVIGANPGSVYVYRRDEGGVDNWGEVTKFTPIDGPAQGAFGYSVAISGDTAIVGAPLDDDKGPESGSAFVFRRDEGGADNWGEVTEITPSDTAAGDRFGWSVTISGDAAIVGAYRDDDNGISSGSAYVYVSSACTVASCDDGSLCSFDRCVLGWCVSTDARPGDVAGTNGACGPNGRVDLDDIIAVLNGFGGQYADGCEPANIDIAGDQGSCVPNGITDLFDITAVLDAFAGLDRCCAEGR